MLGLLVAASLSYEPDWDSTEPFREGDVGHHKDTHHVSYNHQESTNCCVNKCSKTTTGKVEQASCHVGCTIWMSKSSLNFDTSGAEKLLAKCLSDCSSARRWREHMDLNHHSFDAQGTMGVHWPDSAKPYWTSFTSIHQKVVEPEDEVQCLGGCRAFKSCISHDEEVKMLNGDVEVGTAPWLRPDPTDWNNPHNRQPSIEACIQQCKGLPHCRYGTYLTAGGRRGECWLSAQAAEEEQPCGEPCESFEYMLHKGSGGTVQ